MKPDEARIRLSRIEAAAGDDEVAHSMEDSLRADFIEHVAQAGPADLAEVAKIILLSDDLRFCRWCA